MKKLKVFMDGWWNDNLRTGLIVLLLLIVGGLIFARGYVEEPSDGIVKRTLIVLHSGEAPSPSGLLPMARAAELTMKDFPGLTVELQVIDLSTGAPVTMDTLIAAGTPPDVYGDSMVRLSRYIVPEFAMKLDEYMDVSPYLYTEPLKRNGHTFALPSSGSAQGICLNLDLLAKAGYTVPDNWTLADFNEMCAAVKAYADKTGEEVYGTGLFAGNQSGDYLWMNWFAVFGVDLYSDNYTESTQVKGGDKVWEYFKYLKDKGYIPSNSAALTDDDYALMWSKGQFAATAFFTAWAPSYLKSAMEQGLIKEPHKYKFVAFPNGSPACTNWAGIIGNKDTKYPAETAAFIKYATDVVILNEQVKMGQVAYRNDLTAKANDPRVDEINEIVAKNGLYDLGVTNQWFAEVRAQGYPILQSVLSGKMTPKEAAVAYTKAVNEIIQ